MRRSSRRSLGRFRRHRSWHRNRWPPHTYRQGTSCSNNHCRQSMRCRWRTRDNLDHHNLWPSRHRSAPGQCTTVLGRPCCISRLHSRHPPGTPGHFHKLVSRSRPRRGPRDPPVRNPRKGGQPPRHRRYLHFRRNRRCRCYQLGRALAPNWWTTEHSNSRLPAAAPALHPKRGPEKAKSSFNRRRITALRQSGPHESRRETRSHAAATVAHSRLRPRCRLLLAGVIVGA